MNSSPLISIIIPAFNAARFLPQAFASIESEKQHKWELILVDDAGQEDGTKQLLEKIAKAHPDRRIELIRHKKNLGVSQARRTGWQASQGELIAFLDADDLFLPNKIAEQTDHLSRHPRAVLVHGPVLRGPDYPNPATKVAEWSLLGDRPMEYQLEEHEGYLRINRICNSSVICRREAITEDCFPARMKYQAEDWFLWLRLAQHGPFVYHPKPLTFYRDHAQSYFSGLQAERGDHEFVQMEVLTLFFPYAKGAKRKFLCAKEIIACITRLVNLPRGAGATPAKASGIVLRFWLAVAAFLTTGRAVASRLFSRI